jgi:hypothetical protein
MGSSGIVGTYGPPTDSMVVAYRPVLIAAQFVGTPPPEVYCDVYFFGVYYATLSTNVPFLTFGSSTFWQFDLQGLAQQFIQTLVYDITTETLTEVYGVDYQYGQTSVFCAFRTSTEDSYGVLTPEGPVPIQASLNSPAVAGGGYVSDQTWYIVNASLQITDSQNLLSMVQAFQVTGVFYSPCNVSADYGVYQMSYKSCDKLYANDYGQIALLTTPLAFLGRSSTSVCIVVYGYNAAGAIIWSEVLGSVPIGSGFIYTLPVGMANLSAMFTYFASYISAMSFYRVGIFDPAVYPGTETHAYISPKMYIAPHDGVIAGQTYLVPGMTAVVPKHSRIWFKNYLGQFDAVNFIEREEALKVSSSGYESPITVIPDHYNATLNQWNFSNQSRGRYAVRSSEISQITGLFNEQDMPLLKQLCNTAQAFLETRTVNGEADPPQTILQPIVIQDGSYPTQVFEGREEYRLTLSFIPSNENIIVR